MLLICSQFKARETAWFHVSFLGTPWWEKSANELISFMFFPFQPSQSAKSNTSKEQCAADRSREGKLTPQSWSTSSEKSSVFLDGSRSAVESPQSGPRKDIVVGPSQPMGPMHSVPLSPQVLMPLCLVTR